MLIVSPNCDWTLAGTEIIRPISSFLIVTTSLSGSLYSPSSSYVDSEWVVPQGCLFTDHPVEFDEILEAKSSRKSSIYGKSFGCDDIEEEE